MSAYIKNQHVEFPVMALRAEASAAAKLGSTPTTFVVNPQGVIEKIWVGAYVDAARPEIERYFSVSLPSIGSFGAGASVRATSRP